ncbi:MAG: HAMP domain-containing protein [Desulfobacterales bacterium]|nr:HAMP domain-containing protein [Desulfobacterales bacterium]
MQNRILILLLIPVFCVIFTIGLFSYLHTRDTLIDQWDQSAILKLQRAAHYIEMRIIKPIELMEVLFQISREKKLPISPENLAVHIQSLEGVISVTPLGPSRPRPELNTFPVPIPRDKGTQLMTFRHCQIARISNPSYDRELGQETVRLLLTYPTVEFGRQDVEIEMSFDYLLKDIIALGWWESDMACIVNGNGRYIAHTNMAMENRTILGETGDGLEQELLHLLQTETYGTISSPGYPPEMVAGFHMLDKIPWAIILFARGENLLTPLIQYRNISIASSFFLICLVLFLIRHQVGYIVRQITSLSTNARQVARGRYGTPLPVNTRDEIGQLVGSYNEMVQGLKERDLIRDSFGRYVDPEFARTLLARPEEWKLGGKRREVVVMMSDLRQFTAFSESLDPEVIIRVLNQYFSAMIQVIQEHRGIIVDFYGDGVLAFFDPMSGQTEDAALTAVQCASQMQERMIAFNREIGEENLPGLDMGIGINSGPVIVGNIGSKARAKYGIVGAAVNQTSRIQAEAGPGEIIVSDSVYSHTRSHIQVEKRFTATLKGLDQSQTLRVIQTINN